MDNKKKPYEAPTMLVINIESKTPILIVSGGDPPQWEDEDI